MPNPIYRQSDLLDDEKRALARKRLEIAALKARLETAKESAGLDADMRGEAQWYKDLRAIADVCSEAEAIRQAMLQCRRGRRCHQLGCAVCRHLHREHARRRLLDRTEVLIRSDIAWVTVINRVPPWDADFASIIKSERRRLSRLLRAIATEIGSGPLICDGAFELDFYYPGSYPSVKKLETLEPLGYEGGLQKCAVLHLHMVVASAGLRRGRLGRHLRETYPGPHRVQVRSLRKTPRKRVSLRNLSGYTSKRLPVVPIPPETPEWDRQTRRYPGLYKGHRLIDLEHLPTWLDTMRKCGKLMRLNAEIE